jgi:hypothetical protein
MDLTYEILLTLHAIAGVIALVTYWAAALLRKGSPAHRAVGKAYLLAMLVIVVTGAPMAVIIAMKGKPGIATFLGYLVVITATGMWSGWRAIRRKGQQQAFRDGTYAAVAWLNVASSVAVFAVGWQMSQALLMGFSMVGLLGGTQMLYLRARPMTSPRWWLEEHFSAMVGTGVATHIAFLAIGLDRIVRMAGIEPPAWYHLIAWFLPLALAFVAVPLLRRKYGTAPAAQPA